MLVRRVAAVATVLALAGCSSSGSSTSWRELSAGSLGDGVARLVHAAGDGQALIGVGSVTVDGNRVPALWRTTDGTTWQRLEAVPKSITGVRSELTAVAVTPGGAAAAVGQTTGGVHGNPRIASWYLDAAALTEVPGPVELYGGPRQGSVNEMAAGPAGFVVVGTRTDRNERTGAAVWTSPDGRDLFTIHDADPALESAPDELVRALGVAANQQEYLAVGDRFVSGTGRIDGDAVFWTSSDGQTWARLDLGPLLGGPGSELPQLATAWKGGWAVAGTDSAGGSSRVVVWSTADGTTWQRSAVDALGADPDGLSAVTSLAVVGDDLVVGARLGSRLAVARSADGTAWTTVELPRDVPTGSHAVVLAVGAGERLVVAATGDDTSTRVWSQPQRP